MRISMKVRNPKILKESIALNGDSYRSYANRIEISYGYLSQIINQKANASPRTAKKIANGIHMEISDIFLLRVLAKVKQRRVPRRSQARKEVRK